MFTAGDTQQADCCHGDAKKKHLKCCGLQEYISIMFSFDVHLPKWLHAVGKCSRHLAVKIYVLHVLNYCMHSHKCRSIYFFVLGMYVCVCLCGLSRMDI